MTRGRPAVVLGVLIGAACGLHLLTGCHLLLPFQSGDDHERDGRAFEAHSVERGFGEMSLGDRGRSDAGQCRIEVPLLRTADDGEMFGAMLLISGEPGGPMDVPGLFMGCWYTDGPTWGYFTFTLPAPLPPGAKDLDVHLELRTIQPKVSMAQWSTANHALRIYREKDPIAANIASERQRPETGDSLACALASSIRWPHTGMLTWPPGIVSTPNLASLVNVAVGLPAGTRLRFWMRGDFDCIGSNPPVAQGEVTTFDVGTPGFDSLQATKLVLSWTLPGC